MCGSVRKTVTNSSPKTKPISKRKESYSNRHAGWIVVVGQPTHVRNWGSHKPNMSEVGKPVLNSGNRDTIVFPTRKLARAEARRHRAVNSYWTFKPIRVRDIRNG